MKKIFMAILSAVFLIPSAVWGELLLTENFDYATGNLYQKGASIDPVGLGWIKYSTNTVSPIQVIDESLVKSGYQTEGQGKAIELTNANAGEDLQIAFTNTAITSGVVYASMLVKVTAPTDKTGTYFAAFAGTNNSNKTWQDGMGGTDYCRLFVKQNPTTGKFNFGISRGSTTTVDYSDCNIGETYLVIMKYDLGSGLASAWINPTNVSDEPASTISSNNGSSFSSTYGITGVQLRQGTNFSYTAATITIDALRVATSWTDLFEDADPDPTPGPGPDPEPEPEPQTIDASSIANLLIADGEAIDYYNLTGEAVVTYVNGTTAYVEDATGALALSNANGLAVGDIVTAVKGTRNAVAHTLALVEDVTIVSNGNEVTPAVYSLNDLNAQFSTLMYRYVKIENVKFTASSSVNFNSGSYKIQQGSIVGYVASETGYIRGTEIPVENVNVVGFCGSNLSAFELKKVVIETIEQDAPVEINADLTASEWAELSGKNVQITINRSLTAGMINTICLPYTMSNLNEVFGTSEVYALTGASLNYDNELVLSFTTISEISAGRPYFIIPTKNVTSWTTEAKVTLDTSAKITSVDDVDFVGVLTPTELVADDMSVLFLGANNTLFYPNVTANILGMRGYFRIKNAVAKGAPARVRLQNNTTTGVEEVLTTERAQKLLQEGRVILRIDGHDYDINGNMIR